MHHKYSVQRLEPFPFKVRNELRKNMTNLPMRWKDVAFSDDIKLLSKYVDKNHRVINYETQEVVIRNC